MNPVMSLHLQPPPKLTVLLIEDDFSTRWAAAEFLRATGFAVIEAVDVNEALAVLLTSKPIDVVFAELRPAGEHGGEFISAWLEKHRPHIPVLLTSGDATGAALTGENPRRRFVLKPYNLPEVTRLLRAMLGNGQLLP